MADGMEFTQFDRFVDSVRTIPDPLARLDAIRASRETLEALEQQAVRDARHAGVTWKSIGVLYGLSKQGAQQRFRPSGDAPTSTPVSD